MKNQITPSASTGSAAPKAAARAALRPLALPALRRSTPPNGTAAAAPRRPEAASSSQQAAARILGAAAAVAVGCAACAPAAWAGAVETFALKCAGCHMNGGNVLQAGASLSTDDLQKNGLTTPEAVYRIIYSGKGKMPGFGTDCAPKGACTFGPRFSDAEVQEQTDYVLAHAAAGWKAVEP